jgi:hypothetical protein
LGLREELRSQVESNPNIEDHNSIQDVTDPKLEEDVLVAQNASPPNDNVESETLKTQKTKEGTNEIVSFLDFFRHCYSLKGKKISISVKTVKKIEEKKISGFKHDTDLANLLKSNVVEDKLLNVSPQILIAVMGSKFDFQSRLRIMRYISQSVHEHPMLFAEEYRNALMIDNPDLDQLFRKLTDSIRRFSEKQNSSADKSEHLSPDALEQLRRNSIATFLLIFSIKQQWPTEKFITCFNKYYLETRHQIDVAERLSNNAAIAEPGRDASVAIVAKVLLKRIDALSQELSDAARKIESNYLRALKAEDEVGKALETIAEKNSTILSLETQISQLTMEIANRETAILNAATHHIDDYDAIRTRVLRTLSTQVDLLTDGLHALRKDNKEVAEEFMDRTISSLNREIEKLRISREVGD